MLNEVDLLDIQARLRADTSGAERAAIERSLDDLAARLKRTLDAGVPPADFARLQAVQEAVGAARDLVGMAWRRYHPGVA